MKQTQWNVSYRCKSHRWVPHIFLVSSGFALQKALNRLPSSFIYPEAVERRLPSSAVFLTWSSVHKLLIATVFRMLLKLFTIISFSFIFFLTNTMLPSFPFSLQLLHLSFPLLFLADYRCVSSFSVKARKDIYIGASWNVGNVMPQIAEWERIRST